MNIVADADEIQIILGLHAKLRESPGEHCLSERCEILIDIISRKKFRKGLPALGDYLLLLFLELKTKICSVRTKDKLVKTNNSNVFLESHLFLFDLSLFFEDNLIM